MSELILSCFYYPGYHPTPENDRTVAPGWTEWEMVRQARPHYPGHYQPRVPLWGYQDDSRPEVMAQKVDCALSYGIGHFHFVWYWYEQQPFLQHALERGYLSHQAEASRHSFSILWANHDRFDGFPEPTSGPVRLLFSTDYSQYSLHKLIDYWIEHYLCHPAYHRTPEGALLLTIHVITELIDRGGGEAAAGRFIERLRRQVAEAGLGAVHLNTTQGSFCDRLGLLASLGFDSVSNYCVLGYTESHDDPLVEGLGLANLADLQHRPAAGRTRDVTRTWAWVAEQSGLPYFPVVTVGRDCSPRVDGPPAPEHVGRYGNRVILDDATPELLAEELTAARQFLRSAAYTGAHPRIFVNCWNEWSEGAYLEPDERFQYRFLAAVAACRDAWDEEEPP